MNYQTQHSAIQTLRHETLTVKGTVEDDIHHNATALRLLIELARMEGNRLDSILINTFNPHFELRTNAERALAGFLACPGSCLQLLQLISTMSQLSEVRLAAVIVLKNRIEDFWSHSEGLSVLVEEKTIFKQQIVDVLLAETDSRIKALLSDVICLISNSDFPHDWTMLVPSLLNGIQSRQTDANIVFNALLAFRKLVKRFEHKHDQERAPLVAIIDSLFPVIQDTIFPVVASNNSVEGANVLKLCLKIFWSCTMSSLPVSSKVNAAMWFSVLCASLDKYLPEPSEVGLEPVGQPLDIIERPKWPFWKMKKWASKIMVMFIQKYGNPKYTAPENTEFANYFRSNISLTFLNSVVNLLLAKANGRFVSSDVTKLCIQYMTYAMQLSPTYKMIKPHLDVILVQIMFPAICLSNEEEEIFESDPTEYIKLILSSILDDCVDARLAAIEFLHTMAKFRHNDLFPSFLPFLQSILSNEHTEPKVLRAKDGAMLAVTTIADIFRTNKKYRQILPSFIAQHVLPCLSNNVPFLRARACWVIEHTQVSDYYVKSGNQVASNRERDERLHVTIVGLLNGLRDSHLPVQTAAANAIGAIVSFETAAKALEPLVPQLISEYIRIITQNAENRDILLTLQAVVLKYGDIVRPLAPQLVVQLQQVFFQMIGVDVDGSRSGGQVEDEESAMEEGSVFSATQCLETITTVIDICQDDAAILQQLDPILTPLLHRLLRDGEHSFEYLSACLEMLGFFTYFLDQFSPNMWSLCGPLLQAMNGWAFDFMQEMLSPLLNFVTKDIKTFLAGSHAGIPYVQWYFMAIEKGMQSTVSESDHDARVACTLIICLLISTGTSSPGSLDSLVNSVLQLALFTKLPTCKSAALRIQLIEVGLACIFYNPIITFSCLEAGQANGVQTFFGCLLSELPRMNNQQSKRLIVYAFSKVLLLLAGDQAGSVPPVVGANALGLFRELVNAAHWVNENDVEDDDDDDDDGDDDFDFDAVDGDVFADADMFDRGDDIDKSGLKAVRRAMKSCGIALNSEGFNEDEDCINEEDEAFQAAVDDLRTSKRGAADDGDNDEEFGDLELADMDDFAFTMPTSLQNIAGYSVLLLQQLEVANPNLVAACLGALDQELSDKLSVLRSVASASPASSIP